MKKLTIIFVFLLFLFSTKAQIIPADRVVDWHQTQHHFRFTVPDVILNITDYGGSSDGQTDNTGAFTAAMNDAGDNPAIIYFPEGNYLFNSSILLKSGIVIKGAGSNQTTLLFDLNNQNANCINITGTTSPDWTNINAGYQFGSRKINLYSYSYWFSAGETVEIREQNGDWDTDPASWATNVVGQIVMIDSVKLDTLYLHSPLRIDYQAELFPVIRKVMPVTNAGVECLKIKRLDEPETGGGYNIYFSYAQNCRVTGIESDTSVGSHVYISQSLNIRVTGSYFHHAFKYDGASTHGYGVTLAHRASECVVENNIFEHLRHAIMVKTGANGNVFGYNFSTDVYRTEFPHNYGGDISLHGHYAYANLFESNIVENIILDHYWGPSGPLNTFFRNRATLWGIIFTSSNEQESNRQNIVGNEVTNSSPVYGMYSLTGSDHFEYGNIVKGNNIPQGTDSLPDKSYYLYDWPPFWDIYCVWPSIGIPNEPGSGSIPAEGRYLSGTNLTYCTDDVIDAVKSNYNNDLNVWPNPNNGIFYVKTKDFNKNVNIKVFSMSGEKVFSQKYDNLKNEVIKLKLKPLVGKGIYILRIQSGNKISTAKIYVQ